MQELIKTLVSTLRLPKKDVTFFDVARSVRGLRLANLAATSSMPKASSSTWRNGTVDGESCGRNPTCYVGKQLESGWENHGKIMGKYWKIMGNISENIGTPAKRMEVCWENHGNLGFADDLVCFPSGNAHYLVDLLGNMNNYAFGRTSFTRCPILWFVTRIAMVYGRYIYT